MNTISPLGGIKVLDFTAFVSGTTCTEQLAWMGAEVFKVERPVLGEMSRYSILEPGVDTVDFALLNMNKRSITCNLKSPEGIAVIKELIKRCDVLVENMNPGAIDRLGIGYEVCRELNPRLIFTQIKGFDMNGPYRDYPCFNNIAVATGGMGARVGTIGGEPLIIGPADPATGMMAASAILAALLQREKTGLGQHIQIAMQEVVMALTSMDFFAYNDRGVPPERCGNEMGTNKVAPHNVYRCSPGGKNDYVTIYCSRHPGSKQFEFLCKAIGREDLLSDPRMADPYTRYANQDYLDPQIEAWTLQRTKQEVMDILSKAGVPCGAVLDVADLSNDEYLRSTGAIIPCEHPKKGTLYQPGFVPKMSDFKPNYGVSPALGEGNDDIYGKLLGMSDEERKALAEKKII